MVALKDYLQQVRSIPELWCFCDMMTISYSFCSGRSVKVLGYTGTVDLDCFLSKVFEIFEENLDFPEWQRHMGQKIAAKIKSFNTTHSGYGKLGWKVSDIETIFHTYSQEQWKQTYHQFPLPAPEKCTQLHGKVKRYSLKDQMLIYTNQLNQAKL